MLNEIQTATLSEERKTAFQRKDPMASSLHVKTSPGRDSLIEIYLTLFHLGSISKTLSSKNPGSSLRFLQIIYLLVLYSHPGCYACSASFESPLSLREVLWPSWSIYYLHAPPRLFHLPQICSQLSAFTCTLLKPLSSLLKMAPLYLSLQLLQLVLTNQTVYYP